MPGDTNATWDVFVRDRGPATGVGSLSAARSGDRIEVSGWARFAGGPVTSADDSLDDGASTGPLTARDLGAELTGASLIYRPEHEDLLVTIRLASLAGTGTQVCLAETVYACAGDGTGAGLPGVVYGLDLEVGDSRYQIRALRAAATADPPTAPYLALYRCDPECTEDSALAGGIGTTGDAVLVSVPLSRVGASEGTTVEGIRAFTALGEASPGDLVPLDEVALADATIPVAVVSLGVAAAGTPGNEVVFDTGATLTAGVFSAAVEAASPAAGPHDVWVRACLGATCGPDAVAVDR